MQQIVIGVRHQSAPIEVREKLAFPKKELDQALSTLLTYPGIAEAAILSTCNRTEIYASVTDSEAGMHALKAFLRNTKGFDYTEHMHHIFMLMHEDAVMHLFRVASGLDSLALGEGQILSQVKEAMSSAMACGAAGEVIENLFKTAITVGKAVRSETDIASRDASIARWAFEHVQERHPDFLQGNIALIGAGKMNEILLECIRQARSGLSSKQGRLLLVNRSLERLADLQRDYQIEVCSIDELNQVAHAFDTFFVATGSPNYLIKPEAFDGIDSAKVIMDISVPRNVDPAVGELAGISLYNTDSLSNMLRLSGERKLQLIHQAHQIIEREYRKYYHWYHTRPATPVIKKMRKHVEDIRKREVDTFSTVCPKTNSQCNIIDKLSRSLVNKILHDPTVQLRSTPELEDIYRKAEMLSFLFKLPGEPGPCLPEPDEAALEPPLATVSID